MKLVVITSTREMFYSIHRFPRADLAKKKRRYKNTDNLVEDYSDEVFYSSVGYDNDMPQLYSKEDTVVIKVNDKEKKKSFKITDFVVEKDEELLYPS